MLVIVFGRKIMLEKIDIHLVDHCNLKCKSCTHFSSIADEFFLDIDEFEKDMRRLSKLTQGNIKQIFLVFTSFR